MERTFSAFRYLITASKDQYNLFASTKSKEELIKEVFDDLESNQKTIWTHGNKRYMFAGVERYENLMFIKFAKHVSTKSYKETESDISIEKVIEPKFIHLIIDESNQILLVENNTQIFQKPRGSANLFSKFVSSTLKDENFKLNIYPLATAEKFWNQVKEADSIYSLKLEFNAPNMALFAGETTQEILKIIKEETNNEELDVSVKNSKGNLKIKKSGIGKMIDYIREVGGEIIMKYKNIGDKKMNTFNSEQDILNVHVKIEDENIDTDTKINLIDILSKISKLKTRK